MTPMSAAGDLHHALVEAYEGYVGAMRSRRGLPEVDGWEEAVEEGRRWLDQALGDLLAQSPARQRRSPLELFQDALRFPTEALAKAGVATLDRDQVEAAALPGDVYGLAPASSRDLGVDAWRAHVAWGISKAEVVAGARLASAASTRHAARPVVALLSSDIMDRSKVEPVVRGAGLTLELWRNPAAVAAGLEAGPPSVVLVDLTHPAADDAIARAAVEGVRVVAFGPHVDDVAMERAIGLGASDAMARSRFFRALPALLPRLV